MSRGTTKTRFAPSPTGRMHLGNLRTALFNALYARAGGGVFLLRVEDTDRQRSREEYLQGIMTDLRWLGLDWQEGPERDAGRGPYQQSLRGGTYAAYFAQLESAGLAYPCFCSETELRLERKRALAAGRPPRYSGKCAGLDAAARDRQLASGRRPTLRFRVPPGRTLRFEDLVRGPQESASDDVGDFVVRRADGTPAFFFSNALDDALMGVTHVLRGEDHLTNTPRQLLLLEALGLEAPHYGHISLILDSDGGPLSKRGGSLSVAELREQGYLPLALLNHLARLGHHYPESALAGLDDLAQGFGLDRLGRAPARHDDQQLRHWQKLAVEALAPRALAQWVGDWDRAAGGHLARLVPAGQFTRFIEVVAHNMVLPDDALEIAEDLYGQRPPGGAALAVIREAGSEFFERAAAAYAGADQPFADFAAAVRSATGKGGRKLFMPLRAALTHRTDGPEMARLLSLLSAERARQRFADAVELARD